MVVLTPAGLVSLPAADRGKTQVKELATEATLVRNAAGAVMAKRIETRVQWADLHAPAKAERALHSLASASGTEQGSTVNFAGGDAALRLRAAAALAAAREKELYRVDLGAVSGKYIGETEKNLDRLLRARRRKVMGSLFFDEADALFGRRSDVGDAHDRYANLEVSYLLQRLEDYPGLAILATNRPVKIDPALRKRIRHTISFASTDDGP